MVGAPGIQTQFGVIIFTHTWMCTVLSICIPISVSFELFTLVQLVSPYLMESLRATMASDVCSSHIIVLGWSEMLMPGIQELLTLF